MKKEFLYFKKSRWLLLVLLTMIVGASPTWAQVTESFESVTLVDADTWGRAGKFSNGWVCISSTGAISNTSLHATSEDYPFYLYSSGKTGDKSLGGIASSTNNYYLVIPTLVSGDVTYYCKGTSSTYGYLRFYKVTDNGDDTYTIGSQIGSLVSKNSSSGWVSGTASVGDEETMIAIKMNRMAIDDITYTPYVEGGCKKPKNLTTSNITFESAELSWTKGEDSQDAWQIVYSTNANFDKDAATPINVNSTSYSFTGLNENTTYYVAVRSYCGSGDGEQSGWVSSNFTTPLAPITSFPWSEDFSGITSGIPAGWDNSEGTTTTESRKWNYYSSGHQGAGLRFDSYNNYSNNTNFLKTPAMNFPAGKAMQLKFWYKNPKGGDFSVYISNDGGATYTTELATSLTGASSWTEKVIDIPSEFVNNVVIVFKGTSNYGSGDAYIYLDDVLVKENAAYAMSVSGEDVVSNTIAFGEVKNTSTTKTFTISNDGASALTNVSVVSSDASIFTVSETGFDVAAGATKEITVTFVKGVVGEYSETVTISQANLANDIVLTVTGSYATPSVANMAVKVGEEAVGATVAFGNVGKQTSKTITVANTGEADLVISSITSDNTTDFTVSPSTLTVQGGSSKTFEVTFLYDEDARDVEKTANITVTASNEGIEPVVFAVTGTRIEQWSEDFSGNKLPDGWEITNSSYWKIEDNMAKGSYSYGNYDLVTPSLVVEEGQTMTFDYRMTTSTYRSLDIQYSKNNGTWTALGTISYSGLTLNQWYTYTIEGLEAGNYKFRFGDSNYDLKNFQGFKRNMNDPKMGIYSDEDCTVAVATSVTKDFGFATETQTATYYIKNDGTGTMTLSLGDAPAGLTQSLDKTSVAAGEHATLTITMPAENKGYNGGNVVVTATDLGTFTVAVSGVIVDDTKLNLNFASDNIPASWTANDWQKDASGYLKTGQYGYSNTTMETTKLTAEAGEKLVVVAKNGSTSSSYTFGVKYKKADAEEWSDLIAAANIGTSWTTLVGTIAEAGEYLLQFNGYYANIQRIYGLAVPQEPVMVVYDGEELAAATYNFGNVSDENDATWTLTVKNEGQAELTGLAAALTGDDADHYSVEVSATTIAVNETATITVKQLKDNLGSHTATLTISATGLDNKVIALSGNTYDHTKLFVDFDNPNALPAGWTAGTSWSVYTYGDDRYAQQSNYSTASALVTTPLTVAEDETLKFQAGRYSSYSACELKVRYTTDGGLTWSEYVDYASQITSSAFVDLELTGVPAGTVVVEFYGRYVKLDNIYGFTATTAPLFALTESSAAVENNSTKEFGTLTAEATATYTLTNNGTADMVSTVATTGVATAAISGEAEGVTIADNKVTLAAGKSATITLTLPYEAPYGEKEGVMTITTEGWVADFTVNYIATTVDPTALYVDFADNTKPEGWYQEGWSFTSGYASAAYVANKQMITQKLTCAGTDDVLSFDVWPYTSSYGSYANALTVEYSADRQNWTAFANQPAFDNTDRQNGVQVSGAPAGDYYVRFTGSYVYMDNIAGWHKVTGIEHDLYVSATSFPTATLIPETSNGVAATATVYSLRADETGVYAKLFFDETEMATSTTKDIANNDYEQLTMTCNVPAEEGTYAAKIVVYYSDNSVAWETATTDVVVAHTRTLNITEFARYKAEEEADELEADWNNQISPAFDVTVENTGSTALTPIVKVKVGETVVGTATAAEAVAAGESTTIRVNATNMSAGEGGELSFTAEAYWSNEESATAFPYATPVEITVTAAAPKFDLAVKGGDAVADGDAVAFGLVKEATTKTYTITNNGTAALELISIVAPEGYEATAVTNENKTIAVSGTLDIDVTLQAEQGKKSGDLVFTYKVDATTNKNFTLALSGRSVATDTWTVEFDGTQKTIPADWTNNGGWQIAGEYSSYPGAVYAYGSASWLMTPRLAAEESEELTFDVAGNNLSLKVEYSTNKTDWTEYATITTAGEQSFIAPAAGNYYLRFTDTYAYLSNFVGFKLNPLEHDTEIASSSVPTTGKQYNTYTATVTLKESAGKAEEVTAKLYVGGEEKTSKTETITANGSTTVTLTWEPQTVISEAVKAYVAVTGTTGIDLATEQVDLTIAEVYTLDEESDVAEVELVSDETVLLKRTFAQGWNTICLPFDIEVATIHADAKAFSFDAYSTETSELTFNKVTTLSASIPYVIFVPKTITEPMKVQNVTITSTNNTAFYSNHDPIKFQGTYAPVTFSEIDGDQYGLTAAGKIVKASSTASMKGFRGYFTGVPANARVAFFGDDNVTTGITNITVEQEKVEGVYNLNGQRVQSLKKNGLYIINGKKVVVK